MKDERKHYTAAEKVAILRRHLLDKLPISEVSEEKGVTADGFLPVAEGILRERSGCL